VTLRIVIDGAPIVETVGLVPAAHGWVWLLPAARYAAYLAGDVRSNPDDLAGHGNEYPAGS